MRLKWFFLGVWLLFVCGVQSQNTNIRVKSFFDRSEIQIGEQVNYTIQVTALDSIHSLQTDSDTIPYLEKLGDLEIVRSDVEMRRDNNQYIAERQYVLTHFDAGQYRTPREYVYVNGQPYVVPSTLLIVNEPVIEGEQQLQIFDIRRISDEDMPDLSDKTDWRVWILILITLGLLVGTYFYFFKSKTLTRSEQETLVREQALASLSSDYTELLETKAYKAYYSKVTDAFRLYIDQELKIPAMEYTSYQLLRHLEKEITDYRLKQTFDKETLKRLSEVFKSSDLAKFAKINPDKEKAHSDQKFLLKTIKEIDGLLEKDREKTRLEEEAQLKRANKNRISWYVVTSTFVLIFSVLFIISLDKSYRHEAYRVLGMQSQYLSEKQWISSFYGNPGVSLRTPNYLKRVSDGQDPTLESFVSGGLNEKLFVQLTTKLMPIPEDTETSEIMMQVKEATLKIIENMGGENLMETGVDVDEIGEFAGFFEAQDVTKAYKIWVITTKSGIVSMTVIFDRGNTTLEKVAKRIQKSIRIEEEE